MKEGAVTYQTDNVAEKYSIAISSCQTLSQLRETLADWAWIADDALDVAFKMDNQAFEKFLVGLSMERSGIFAGEEWNNNFGSILMPNDMFAVSAKALQMHVTFGTMYKRMKELRALKCGEDWRKR